MKTTDPCLYTRRRFLRSSLAVTATAATLPEFLTRTSLAAETTALRTSIPGMKNDHVLVVIQLSGGNDGLNTVVPFADPDYARARPTLALRASDLIPVSDEVGLHGGLDALRRAYDEGEVAWVQNVGYPNPNRSHFRSMEIWHTASDADEEIASGWIGRYFDNACRGAPIPATASVTVGKDMPEALRTPGGGAAGIVLEDPEVYGWKPSAQTDRQGERLRSLFDEMNRMADPEQGRNIDYLQRTALDASSSSDLIAEAERRYRSNVDYPNTRFARDLRLVAKLVTADIGGRVFYVSLGGFDTHAGQAVAHRRLLTWLAEGIAAFRKDMLRARQWDRIAMMGFSEFGRRVAENNSQGTDHGAAGPMFLVGPGVLGGLHGAPADLADLERGDLRHGTDFRSVYGAILDHWLGVRHADILGRTFPPVALFG